MTETKNVSRIRIPFFLDVVTIHIPSAIEKAETCGELERLAVHATSPNTLPIPFSLVLLRSRFYSANHGWFIPFRSESHPAYPPCHAFLKEKLDDDSIDIQPLIKRAVDSLEAGADDIQLSKPVIEYLYSRFSGGECPSEKLLTTANLQVRKPEQLISPLFFRAISAMNTVYSYVESTLEKLNVFQTLPKDVVTDVAHCILTPVQVSHLFLRAVYNNPEKSVEQVFTELAITDQLTRLAGTDGTLGGLLDVPMKKGHTLVLLNIGEAAKKTGDWKWAFSAGAGRMCLANQTIRKFAEEVRIEILRRRQ